MWINLHVGEPVRYGGSLRYSNWRVMQGNIEEMQSEIRGLQTENRRILDRLERGERE